MPFHITVYLTLVSGSMNSEKYQNDIILGDIKMQCEYVAFPCKEYIFMHAKVSAPGQRLLHSREGCYSVDWLGISSDLQLIGNVLSRSD